ncbi:MAG: hypothetical protein U0359_40900 [Byssovorax sp.]
MAYAVHTRTCTYLLDEEGICRWTLAPSGTAAPGTDRCVGAQFVASLDLTEAGGLVGELRIGAAALFARVEGGRFVLLRTLPIEHVEFRNGAVDEPPAPEPRKVAAALQHGALMEPPLPQPSFPHIDRPAMPARTHEAVPAPPPIPRPSAPPPSTSRAAPPSVPAPPTRPPPAPSRPPPPAPVIPPLRAAMPSAEEIDIDEVQELSVEDLVTFSEVTLTIPLFRPGEPPDRPPPPRKGIVGPGKRLR